MKRTAGISWASRTSNAVHGRNIEEGLTVMTLQDAEHRSITNEAMAIDQDATLTSAERILRMLAVSERENLSMRELLDRIDPDLRAEAIERDALDAQIDRRGAIAHSRLLLATGYQ